MERTCPLLSFPPSTKRIRLDFAAPGAEQDADDRTQQRGFEQKGSKGEGVVR